ncbi:DUF6441 family protein [Paracoccus chinensis]|uniref:Uncharacterized protein n=1 Tax=Paracoccus chinensis TaxID=525640 RepID=A0A1G9JHX2_9RHOB|nr:DUF6441 family protein [Paracoccus chinensis]SDL37078.1 hypothetical protein SAMN04487971_109141 [Paracoccus chinensis]
MKIEVTTDTPLSEEMAHQVVLAELAVTRGIRATSSKIKTAWRDDVRRALGQRLSNAIRANVYPEGEPSLGAAALIYARPGRSPGAGAATIVAGHETGSVIRSGGRGWLAIPTEEARAVRLGRQKLTPALWQQRTGIQLQVVVRPNGGRLLVADVRMGKTGRLNRGRLTKKGAYSKGTFTSVIFFLVPQAKLRKRLDLMNKADRLAQRLPEAIVRHWPR